jgi:hypothetical protein
MNQIAFEIIVGLASAVFSALIVMFVASYSPNCFDTMLIAPSRKYFAVRRIRAFVRKSTIFPAEKNKKNRYFFPCASPVSRLLETWLTGNVLTFTPDSLKTPRAFPSSSSFVVYLEPGRGKTNGAKHFMMKQQKLPKSQRVGGVLFSPPVPDGTLSYEENIQRMLGCNNQGQHEFRDCFVKAMEKEAYKLRSSHPRRSIFVGFDEYNAPSEANHAFAFFIMKSFGAAGLHVVPVFFTQEEAIARRLVYMNRGSQMRPFPNTIAPGSEWLKKCERGTKIDWIDLVWTAADKKDLVHGQAMTHPLTGAIVPVLISPLINWEVIEPKDVIDLCLTYASEVYGSGANQGIALGDGGGGRRAPLLAQPSQAV